MNNQQAINLLKDLEQCLDDYCELNDEGKTAFGMAITALELFGNAEQLPSAQPEHLVKESGNLVKGLVNDCISRKAAIEALQNHYEVRNPKQNAIMDECVMLISNVPSAQPEPPEDICGECDAWNKYKSEIKALPSVEELKSEAWDTAYLEGYTAGQNAQPKYVALHESCTDCPLYDRKNYNCPRFNRVIPMAIRDAQTQVKALSLPSAQPVLRTEMSSANDTISRQSTIDALDELCDRECEYSKKQRSVMCGACRLGSAFDVIDELPSAKSDGWLARHRDEILRAGMEGREFEFRINGRLFAIREKAQ